MVPIPRHFSFFCLCVIASTAYASDEPSIIHTNVPSAASNSSVPSAAPSFTAAPTFTVAPSDPDFCSNTPGFSLTEWNRFQGEWHLQTLGCDDILVDCYEYGNIGQVKEHCCKCREDCVDQCNDAVFTSPEERGDSGEYSGFFYLFVPVACLVGLCVMLGLFLLRRKERRIALETAALRQLQQETRENNGLSAEDNAIVRFEQFVTRFHFQIVLADKSNISAEAIRKSSGCKNDEETPTEESTSFDESEQPSGNVVKESSARSIISEQLTNWTKASSAKDECCICLECYAKGETICAPATKRCNHVFHESCIKEWLREQDQCPLCRVNLLKD